jgi:AcrR family transcriptional regulator
MGDIQRKLRVQRKLVNEVPASKPLSRKRILAAAFELADREGIETLSMRRLGHELGVQAMSLYNHVPNKDAILDGLVEGVFAEIDLPDPAADWETELRRCALTAHDALRRHPWASPLAMLPAVGPASLAARLRYVESLLRTLREAGFTSREASYAYHALDSHTFGFTMWQLGHSAPPKGVLAEAALRAVRDGDYPYVLEHAGEHEADRGDEPNDFEFGLDLIFAGLSRMRCQR